MNLRNGGAGLHGKCISRETVYSNSKLPTPAIMCLLSSALRNFSAKFNATIAESH